METPTKNFIPPSPLFLRTPARKLQMGNQQDVCATPTRTLISQTERAIQHYLKDDCETNLPLIRTLEDISYQLWVESNTAFLDESTTLSEDEGWQWDEDCFIDSSKTIQLQTTDDKMSEESHDTSSSSIGSSFRSCDDTDCYMGYLGCSEMDADTSFCISEHSVAQSVNPLEDWVVVEDTCPLQTKDMCPIKTKDNKEEKDRQKVRNRRHSNPIDIKDSKSHRRFRKARRRRPKQTSQQDTEKSSEMYESDINEVRTISDDWTILSMRIHEVSRHLHGDGSDVSLDSGIKSPDTEYSQSPDDKYHKTCGSHKKQWQPFCIHKWLKSIVRYVVQFRRKMTKEDVKMVCCECSKEGLQSVITVLHELLIEVYGIFF